MDTRQTPTPIWRLMWLIPVAALAAVTIIATGGSGGGGGNGDDPDDLPIRLLPSYNFFLTDLQGNAPLTAVVGDMFTVTVDIDGMLPGGLDLSGSSTVTDVSIARLWLRETARIDLSVTSPEGSPLDGSFAVIMNVDTDISDTGFLGSFSVVSQDETVTVASAQFGLTVTLNGGASVSYLYNEFIDLKDDETADPWQRRASLACGALQFSVDQLVSVTEVHDSLEAVTFNNPTVSTCDMFTGTPPDGVLAQGEITITWLGSGELSDGDDFTWDFNQCWNADDEELILSLIHISEPTRLQV